MSLEFQEEKIQVTDRFEVTGYSHKPFYKLSQEENKQLDAKNNKDIIFFKATLIKADEPSTHRAIINGEWVRKHKDKWTGLPITMGHPDFKSNVQMKGRPEALIVNDILKYQDKFAVGRIMKVDEHPTDKRLQDFYGYLDNPDLVKGIANGEVKLPRYGSPYFWHLGQIDKSSFDSKGNFLVNDHAPIHWAFVNSPAMGQEIEIRSMCSGEEMACLAKMQSNSIGEDSQWTAAIESPSKQGVSVVYSCPARLVEDRFENGLDKSFYVEDPLSTLKMSSNSETNNPPTPDNKQQEVNDFMEGKKNLNKTDNAMPPSEDPKEEGKIPNAGEHTDRDKESQDKKPEEQETPEEKTKMETMIEEVRAKAEKSTAKKYEKTIAEKDGEISKLNKTISELTFKEKQTLINESIPDEFYGGKDEDKKKAAEDREFFTKLAKEKGLTTEELSKLLQRVPTKELKIAMGSGKKGIANSAEATPEQIKEGIQQFTLSNKTTRTFIEDSKTTEDQKKAIKDSVNSFLGGR